EIEVLRRAGHEAIEPLAARIAIYPMHGGNTTLPPPRRARAIERAGQLPLSTTLSAVVGPDVEFVAVFVPVGPAAAWSASWASLLSKLYRRVMLDPAVQLPELKFTKSATTSSLGPVVVTLSVTGVLVVPALRPLATSIGLAWLTLL